MSSVNSHLFWVFETRHYLGGATKGKACFAGACLSLHSKARGLSNLVLAVFRSKPYATLTETGATHLQKARNGCSKDKVIFHTKLNLQRELEEFCPSILET